MRSKRAKLTTMALAASLFLGSSSAFSMTSDEAQKSPNGGAVWGSNYFPNVELITQDGESVRFFDDLIKDKVVMINFIYTSCPDTCPLETARLAEVAAVLGDRVGDDVFIYSISIDPERDTPPVLKEYAERYQAPAGWKFLTGNEQDIIQLRKKLGLYRPEIQDTEEDTIDHNLSLIIGNQATGRWMTRSPFENPYVLANQLGGWLHNWKHREKSDNDYANAPALRNISKGESMFRTRCTVCHSIGDSALPKVGPNLLGVTERREYNWLSRWITEPDVMLAEGDSIALGLQAAYNGVAMPNMRLSQDESETILEYIDAESRRVSASQRTRDLVAERDAKEAAGELASCCEKDDAAVIGAEEDESHLAAAGNGPGGPGGSGGSGGTRGFGAVPMASVAMGLLLGLFAVLHARRNRNTASAHQPA